MPSAEVVKVNVRNIAVGGAGVGEVVSQEDPSGDLLGITAFVPFSAVGETVSARVIERKKRYLNTQLLDVEKLSEVRTEPRCPYFMSCGGCELQHISYDGQLQSKFEMIRSALKVGRLSSDAIATLRPIIGGEEYGYRRRITLHLDALSGKVGFYRSGSRSVVGIESCAVAVPEINQVLGKLNGLGDAVRGRISSIVIEADEDGIVAVLKSPYDLADTERQAVLTAAKQFFSDASLLSAEKEIGGFGRKILELPLSNGSGAGQLSLRIPAGSFSQVNWGINQALIAHVIEASQVRFGTKILDLYSGAGNFSLPLARAGAKVIAVETDPRLVLFGRENATRNGVEKNLEFVETSAEKFLHDARDQRFDVIVADPPRSGLGPLVHQIDLAGTLLFVSCHLPSFVRDLKTLTEQGWRVREIQPYDMFAQTSYVEILGVFDR